LSFNKYGDRSNAIGKRFGRLKAALGYGPDYVFHSLRRAFSTQLENAGVERTTVARLMGHELGDQTFGGYSDGLYFDRLHEAVGKIDYSSRISLLATR
jgi:integrase